MSTKIFEIRQNGNYSQYKEDKTDNFNEGVLIMRTKGVYKRKGGRFEVRLSIGINETGKRKTNHFTA